MEDTEEEIIEPSQSFAESVCETEGHFLQRIMADNGFTYEVFCSRCGKSGI